MYGVTLPCMDLAMVFGSMLGVYIVVSLRDVVVQVLDFVKGWRSV